MKKITKRKVVSLFLALIMIFSALPIRSVGANASVSKSINSNYGSVIGNAAEFNKYFPVPISNKPENVKNPWGTDCEQLSDSETPDDLIMVITNYYCSASGDLWYKVKATPGQELPKKLQTNPWVYQDNINIPLGDSLIIHENGKNYVFDEDGNIASSITFTDFNSRKLHAQSTLQGSVKYQWQIEYETGKWVDIHEENDAEIDISVSMIATLLVDDSANVRCVSSCASKSAISDTIKISVDFDSFGANHENNVENSVPVEDKRMVYAAPMTFASTNSGIVTTAEESNTVLVTVQFVMGNNTAPIENGLFTYNVPYNGNVKDNIVIPMVQGYTAYLEGDRTTPVTGTYSLNETNVTKNKTITFRFWPAEVPYKVVYMQQNVSDDGYTVIRTDNFTGLTGSDPVVKNVIYEGFVQIWCDTDKIAADGSTVIEVKYDRLYFKMLFELDGGYGVQPVYARYGTPVSVINPTKAGYIFLGWNALNGPYNKSDDENTVDIGTFTDIEIPAMHTNYKALWQASETAKVTVVIWGQNADDNNYSYMTDASNGLSFQAKPDTEVTYNPNGGYICGYAEEHTHGKGNCDAACSKTEHTHTAVGGSCYTLTCTDTVHTSHTDSCYTCGITNHNHATACYSGVGNRQEVYTGIPDNPSEGYILDHWVYGDLIYIDGYWYRYSGSASAGTIASTNCGKTESAHTHTNACIGTNSSCPGIHTHTDNCYTLSCTTEEHTHQATCYTGCTKEEHTHGAGCTLTIGMNSNLWTFSHADTITVAADGSTTLNVYYDRTEFTLHFRDQNSNNDDFGTITDRWGSNIEERFYEACEKAGYNSWSEKRNASSPWTNHLEIMPSENRTYYSYEGSGDMIFIMTYYKETFVEAEYEKAFEVELHRGNYTTVSEEEYIELEGFEINKSKSTDIGERTDGAVFYYNRKTSHLVFDNYNTIEENKSVLFEAPLSTYGSYTLDASKAPAVYQPGSVTFKGWYLAPQTPNNFNFDNVKPFDFANSTMPATDLKLYAWWEPVTHNVKFYYDYVALEDGTVYEADGISYEYNVPHGSPIQNPYTPPVDPTSSYYSFVGWFYVNENGTETMWDFTYTTVTDDVQLYGKWNSTTPADYEVKFVYVNKDGKEIQIADPIIGRALGGTTKTFDAKFNEELYEDYQDRYYPRDMSHSITINLEDVSQNTFTFYYDYVEYTSYTVKYLEKDTGAALNSEKVITQNTHAMVTETFVPIAGYLPDAYQKVCKIDPDGTNEIIFYYTKDNENGLWTVHYWLENLDGTYSEAIDMLFTGTAKNGATVTAPTDTVIENYTYFADHPNNVSSNTVSINEVTHLHMYYKRTLHNYKVQYLEAGTNKVLAPEKVVEDLKWETLITEYATDADIKVDIYQVYGNAEKSLEISVDETKNVITFYYTEKRVTINYKVVGPSGCGTVTPKSEILQISSGTASGSVANPSSSVYKFVGWYSDTECKTRLTTNTTYVPTKSESTLWINGTTYYAKFEYNLTSLTIKKQGYNSIDKNQTFIFTIKGIPGTNTAGINLTVTIHGNGEITIIDLPIGNYMVTEQTDWSWRYEPTNGKTSQTITLSPTEENIVTFENTRAEGKWLDGNSYKVNVFDGIAD